MVLFRSLVFFSMTACAAMALPSQSQGGIMAEQGLPDGIYQAAAVQGPTFEAPSAIPSSHLSLRGWKHPPGEGDFHEKPGPHTEDEYSVPIHATRHSCHKDRHILLNSTEYRRAIDNLWDYCQNFKVPYHGAHISIVGDVMVYVCAYGRERPCHRHEWNEAEEIMDKKCGQGKGSHVQIRKKLKEYGRAHVGKKVCASSSLGMDLEWKTKPLPVLVNGQPLGHWKAGPPRYKAGDPQYKAEEDGKKEDKAEEDKAEEDGKKEDKVEDDGKKKDKAG